MAGRRANNEGSIYRRKSDGRWCATVLVGYNSAGRPIRKTLTAKTRQEAAQRLRSMQRIQEDGSPIPDATMTVAGLIERWSTDILPNQLARRGADNYRSVARNHILPTLGRLKLQSLSVADVDRLLAQKVADGYSVSTVKRIRSVLAQALDQGMRWGAVSWNVASLSRAPRGARKEGRTLTPEQARLLLDCLKDHRLRALYALMLSVGLRKGEALGLRWEDLDERTQVLRCTRQLQWEDGKLITQDTKTPKSRRSLNLPAQLMAELRAHKARQAAERLALGEAWVDSGYMFTTQIGTPIDGRNLLRDFKKITQAAGLGDWTIHELRHSSASLMLAQGVPLQVVSEVLGHASIRMTADVYGHILEPDRAAAAEAMGNALWG